jgi:selenide,water dikinase
MSPEVLGKVVQALTGIFDSENHPNLLVGLGSPDDAAVFRLDERRVLILTTDFFTPIVDDPYDYGSIAAANALSDVYAMGGRPELALSILAFPAKLPQEILLEVMKGLAEKVREAGAVIAGGHSIQDDEPKVGLCVVGFGDPDKLVTKGGARAGDILILTKPLGSGIITTAAKTEMAALDHIHSASKWMKHLNRDASEVAQATGVRGGTDITGFGLLGHAWEMAESSEACLRFNLEAIPFLEGAEDYAEEGLFPGGAATNLQAYGRHVNFIGNISEEARWLLFDPQTSGGLLLAVPAAEMKAFRDLMLAKSEAFWEVGEVTETGARIEVVGNSV